MKEYVLTTEQRNSLIQSLLNAKVETIGQSINTQNLIAMLQGLPVLEQKCAE